MRLNRPVIGFILGMVMPLIGFLVVFAVLRGGTDISTFLDHLTHHAKDAAKVVSLSILANVLPFLYFTNRRLDYAARGVFIATMLYAVLIVLLRFVW